MKKLYVVGDSFCAYRSDATSHWPAALAKLCNLELKGIGVPGSSWWATRDNLLNYKSSHDFDNTDLFIFCHTEPHRIVTGLDTTHSHLPDKLKELWYKYAHNNEFYKWTVHQWFLELNSLVPAEKTIHVQGFQSSLDLTYLLKGVKITTPLESLSLSGLDRSAWADQMHDTRHNHFEPADNLKLANILYSIYKNRDSILSGALAVNVSIGEQWT